MLGMEEPRGADKSMMRRFFPEYLRVAMAMGLMRGGVGNGPTMNQSATSLSRSESTESRSESTETG